MEPIDLHVEESNDFFRVANAIHRIEEAQDKDIEKIKLLHQEARDLFKYLNINEGKPTIRGLKWDGTNYIAKDMHEEEILKEIVAADDRMHSDKAKKNLILLCTHYKKMWKNSKVYIPFFNYCMELMERIVEHPRIGVIFDDSKRSEELQEVIAEVEQENIKLTDELQQLKEKIEYLKADLSQTLINEGVYKVMGKIYQENIEDDKLIRILLLVQLNKSISLRQIFQETRIAPSDIKDILQQYPKFFRIGKGGNVEINEDVITKNQETPQRKEFEEVSKAHEKILSNLKKGLRKIQEKIKK